MDHLAKVLTFVSRRGAGVWSTLPSLTAELLSKRREFASILWVDLGLRYEMLNHLRIVPTWFPGRACTLGLCDLIADDAGTFSNQTLVTFEDSVLGNPAKALEPACAWTDDLADAYLEQVKGLQRRRRGITLLPLQVATRSGADLDNPEAVAGYIACIEAAISTTRPDLVMFTCEGQPEGSLFSVRLARSTMLQYAINRAHRVICLVRHDSPQRFDDGIAVPALIGQRPEWAERIRIVLTRSPADFEVPAAFHAQVLGSLPFGDFIGRSISRGRIPLLDLAATEASGRPLTSEEISYSERMKAMGCRVSEEVSESDYSTLSQEGC